jgi:fatty acid desaturase
MFSFDWRNHTHHHKPTNHPTDHATVWSPLHPQTIQPTVCPTGSTEIVKKLAFTQVNM